MRVLAVWRVRDDLGLRQLQVAVSHEDTDGIPKQVARAIEGANALANNEDGLPHSTSYGPNGGSDRLPVNGLSNSAPHESPDRLPDEKDESARPVAQPDKWKPDAVSDFVADEDPDRKANDDAN